MIVDSFLCQHDEKISGIVWTYISRVYILRGLLAACIKQLGESWLSHGVGQNFNAIFPPHGRTALLSEISGP